MRVVAVARLGALACVLALGLEGVARAAPAQETLPSAAWVKIPVAELRARYDVLWAVSDVHGRREELERLLVGSGLAIRTGAAVAWNAAARRQLLVVAGDLIDGGPDSVGVVLALERLEREADAAGSRVVVLLGNHEAGFLAHPRSATRELLSGAARHAAKLGTPAPIGPAQLEASAVGRFLRRLPVAAVVGTWLFAHAGCIEAGEGGRVLGDALAPLAELEHRDRRAFRAFLDPRSIVACDGWTRSDRLLAAMRSRLEPLGLNGLVIGHDPAALGARRTIAVNQDGWLLKLDAGLKAGSSAGMLLRCEVDRIVRSGELVMIRDGTPTCRAQGPGGSVPLPIVR